MRQPETGHLQTYTSKLQTSPKSLLCPVSGLDDSWRGDPWASGRGPRRQQPIMTKKVMIAKNFQSSNHNTGGIMTNSSKTSAAQKIIGIAIVSP